VATLRRRDLFTRKGGFRRSGVATREHAVEREAAGTGDHERGTGPEEQQRELIALR
jgi:hypothetical protein